MRVPVQSVELLLDEQTDALVRSAWQTLSEHALPSQGDHGGETNAPHVTIAVREHMPPELDADLSEAVGPLPMTVRLGGLLVFARRRCVLARAVVPSASLLALHTGVHEVLVGCGPTPETMLPRRWTPHVTLARGLTAAQVGAALQALGQMQEHDCNIVAARRWDAAQRRTWLLDVAPNRDRSADEAPAWDSSPT